MSFVIDAVIIISAIAAVYLGIMRGFVKSVMGFVSILLAIIVSVIFTPTLSAYLNENFIAERVSSIVEETITDIVNAGAQRLELESLLEDRPEALEAIAAQFGSSLDEIAETFENLKTDDDNEAIKAIAESVTASTAKAISELIAAIGLFLAALLIFKLALLIIDFFCRLPILSTLNTLLGALFGIFSALLAALLIANTASALIGTLNAIDPAIFNQSIIDDSIILRFMSDNRLIFIR